MARGPRRRFCGAANLGLDGERCLHRSCRQRSALTGILPLRQSGRDSLFCKSFCQAAAAGDRVAMSDADLAFHARLIALSGSPCLARIHSTLMTET
ncbi:FCD domain-containing protein [Cryobacterium sp. Y62]|uniref:FCD domain-containing protein n=1 Tax=Cryobacterium sp. Y62 TaxID=2048284 RepID=UPI0034CD5577